jgi:hypothetical protein
MTDIHFFANGVGAWIIRHGDFEIQSVVGWSRRGVDRSVSMRGYVKANDGGCDERPSKTDLQQRSQRGETV